MNRRGLRSLFRSVIILVAICSISCSGSVDADLDRVPKFELEVLSRGEIFLSPWGKYAGDIDGNGQAELVIADYEGKSLSVYWNGAEFPTTIATGPKFSTGLAAGDLNSDGFIDILASSNSSLLMIAAPNWSIYEILPRGFHSVATADLDNDGRVDIVTRDQSAFGGDGSEVWVLYQEPEGDWSQSIHNVPNGEGLALSDLNRDSWIDVVVNTAWLQNRGQRIWLKHTYSDKWNWPHTSVAVGDFNDDEFPDILLTPSESKLNNYRISWFENPSSNDSTWKEHVIRDDTEAVIHSAAVGDLDLDGDADVLIAEMHQGVDPDNVDILINEYRGQAWTVNTISNSGSHGAILIDADNDGDLDVFGANWDGDDVRAKLWRNMVCPAESQKWIRHEIDSARPGPQAPIVLVADLDGDSLSDILTGNYWYKNPGSLLQDWPRTGLSDADASIAAVLDVDHDSDIDVLIIASVGNRRIFSWLVNNGKGEFEQQDTGLPVNGDFLQGVTHFEGSNGLYKIILSWHEDGTPLEMIHQSRSGSIRNSSTLETVSSISQNEALSHGDIDQDGNTDILTGTRWLQQDGSVWNSFEIDVDAPAPDRNVLADLNNDGRLDAVVGYEAIGEAGDIVWYDHGGSPEALWKKNFVATIVGPMSLDVADMDNDGDLDIVSGEHDLGQTSNPSLWWFENQDGSGEQWRQHLVFQGDEHHDGAIVSDIDNDGDMDIVSIGWGHSRVLLYENKNANCKNADT